jgi:hypothetical protein
MAPFQTAFPTMNLLLFGAGYLAIGVFLIGSAFRFYTIFRLPSSRPGPESRFTARRFLGFVENVTWGWLGELKLQAVRKDIIHYVVGLAMHVPIFLLLLFGLPSRYWSQLLGISGWPVLPYGLEVAFLSVAATAAFALFLRRIISVVSKNALFRVTYVSDVVWLGFVVFWTGTYVALLISPTGTFELLFLFTSFAFIAVFPFTKFFHAILLWFTKGLHGWRQAALGEARKA